MSEFEDHAMCLKFAKKKVFFSFIDKKSIFPQIYFKRSSFWYLLMDIRIIFFPFVGVKKVPDISEKIKNQIEYCFILVFLFPE